MDNIAVRTIASSHRMFLAKYLRDSIILYKIDFRTMDKGTKSIIPR